MSQDSVTGGVDRIFLGRDHELSLLCGLLDNVRERGQALVVRGTAGIGKSALLAAVSRAARADGLRVLTTSGVQSEANLPFAGLHQLLRPIFTDLDHLPSPQRAALHSAFGLSETATVPDLFLIALATLNLLADAAGTAPLLLVCEDAQWLDRPTGDVLAFVARRLASDPIVQLIAIREGFDSPLNEAGLPELELTGLDSTAAASLLDGLAPDIPSAVRDRLLAEADGNPLALVELPSALRAQQVGPASLLPTWLPLTARLERAFADRVATLAGEVQTALLVAAVDDSGSLAEISAAATVILGAHSGVELLSPAVDAQLVSLRDQDLHFHHPLVRSAIYQSSSLPARHQAHAAMAEVLRDQPERRAWHRAASMIGPNPEAAEELEAAADQARRRGGIPVAVAALERAAMLGGAGPAHRRRLLRAAELAFELGRRELVTRLLREAEPVEIGSLEECRLAVIREMATAEPLEAGWQRPLIEMAERARQGGDQELGVNLLWLAAQKAFWSAADQATCMEIIAAVDRAEASADPRLVAAAACAAPAERGPEIIDRLRQLPAERGSDAEAMRLYGSAAVVVGAFALSASYLASSCTILRAQGRLGHLPRVLVIQAWVAYFLGEWDVARPAAEESRRLGAELGDRLWGTGASVVLSILAAARGASQEAEQFASEAEQGILQTPKFMLAVMQLALGIKALSQGHHADAYEQLRLAFEPSHPSFHPVVNGWMIADLAEAAVHSDQREPARAILRGQMLRAEESQSPWLHSAVRMAQALLADDGEAEVLYQAAVQAEPTRWPFYRARVLLAFGAWLRRQRRVSESRVQLRAARDTFDALGAVPWGEAARRELRAAGETSRVRPLNVRDELTAQELQIAQLAAEGRSNREIGQELFLSPRTVGVHLYHMFPKLGITSRTQLHVALRDRSG